MVKSVIITIFCFSFILSCAQTEKLKNGTKVLTKRFNNIDKFDKSILEDINVNYFYKQIDYYMADKNYKKIRDIGKDVDRKIQFYENGRVRFFSLGMEDPDLRNAGRRGIIYLKNNNLKIDTQFADQDGHISKGAYSVKVEGNKIYLLDDNFLFSRPEYLCYVYEKSEKIPDGWKRYKADW